MNRPWRERIWFYKPDLSIDDWSWKWDLRPVWFGDDEYHWKTLVLGIRWTGQIIIATRPFYCNGEDDCIIDNNYPGWPLAYHEWMENE